MLLYHHADVREARLDRAVDTTVVHQPVKLQLIDGSLVVFREGFRVAGGFVHGAGIRYSPTLADSVPVSDIPVDSVSAAVRFATPIDVEKSVLRSIAANAPLGVLIAVGLMLPDCMTGFC